MVFDRMHSLSARDHGGQPQIYPNTRYGNGTLKRVPSTALLPWIKTRTPRLQAAGLHSSAVSVVDRTVRRLFLVTTPVDWTLRLFPNRA